MDADLRRARQDLNLLPSSTKKDEALRLLAEIEKSEVEQRVLLENLDRANEKCRPTEGEQRLFRWLPWFSAALGCMAAYGGIAAILSKEFCSRGRSGSLSCSYGLNAQLHGATTLLVGAVLLMLALPVGRWRTLGLWAFSLALIPALFGSILVR
jgi:hypothetical protein